MLFYDPMSKKIVNCSEEKAKEIAELIKKSEETIKESEEILKKISEEPDLETSERGWNRFMDYFEQHLEKSQKEEGA